ncbi:putative F-box domain, galactose oxidase/kelch, beta-propeller, F-box associated interaction [Helianthus debilis subsp. tardiflorus]
MSDHIPFDIQSQIMNMLPVKSLLRFRSICKQWKSLIQSSDFIAHYRSQQHHLLVSYYNWGPKYVSIADDHTLTQRNVSPTSSVNKMLEYPPKSRIIGCSQGLVCLYCDRTHRAVISNFSIGKSVAVVVPTLPNDVYETILGFGVCRETSDPKIVKITYVNHNSSRMSSQVEVFTLSTGAWRSPFGAILPRKSIWSHLYDDVVIDGVFYWFATDTNATMTGRFKLIVVSFDMTSEEFREITLPDDFSQTRCNRISMSYLGNSLVVCGCDKHAINRDLCVWMMGGGVSNSFTKLFTIPSYGDAMLKGFRKSGDPIIDIRGKREFWRRLAVYEPHSKRIDYLGFDGDDYNSFNVYPYMETLFLLDQPDNGMYSD